MVGVNESEEDRYEALRCRVREVLGLDEGEGEERALEEAAAEAAEAAAEATEATEDGTTQRELVERRLRRMKELQKMYRDQYWRLLDELERKHRRFEMKRGHAGTRDAEEEANAARLREDLPNACVEEGCEELPMPCAKYCFRHIVKDEGQRLYVAGAGGKPRMRDA